MKPGPYEKAVERFLDYLRDQRHVSEQTLRAYISDLEQFRAFLLEQTSADKAPGPEQIDTLAVRGFVAHLSLSGLAKSSVQRTR